MRSSLQSFILELQEIDSNVLDSEDALSELPRDAVTNVFHYTISGNSNIVASGHSVQQTVSQTVTTNDVDGLAKYISQLGASESEVAELREAVAADGPRP